MSLSAVTSLVGHRSSRPAFFLHPDFAKSVGGLSSAASVPNISCSSEIPPSEGHLSVLNGFGGKLPGNSASTRNIFEKPFQPEGCNALKFGSGNTEESRTFLQEFSCLEKGHKANTSTEKDIRICGVKAELYPCCKVTPSEPAEPKSTSSTVPSISSPNLAGLMVNTAMLMIIDCRNFMAYNANHVMGALNVNLSNKITRKRFVDGHLTVHDMVSGPEAKAEYKCKETGAVIVVYDDDTTNFSSLPAAHPLKLLCNRLLSEGRDVRYLEGGIQLFQNTYRQFCQHPDAPPTPAMLYSPTSQDVDAAVDTAVASKILPFLYIGNERDASNEQTLAELGITHVLNVTAQIPFHFEDRLNCKRLKASDSGCQNLKQYFQEAIEFIEFARITNGRVLVHCQAGVSRSPTVVMAYLMARFGKSLQDIFAYVHNRRSIISPNLNFMGQLLEFGQRTDLKSLCVEPLPIFESPELASN